MPYKGSKSEIVKELIANLPPGDHFYDLFGGGGSVAQYALLSGKYRYVHYNELDPLVFKAFSMAIAGDFYGRWYRENYDPDVTEQIPEPWRLVHLERVSRLRELAILRKYFHNGRLILTNDSYDAVQLEPDAVIYCDPPYRDTGGYRFKFNHRDFYIWARKQKSIFISEYEAPADFKLYFEINKRVLLSKDSNGKTVSEKVFTNPEYKESFVLC